MVTERPYRKAMDREVAVEELMGCSGTQFDPRVVEHFIEIIGRDEISNRSRLGIAIS
jgi:HD-GYP domain-containing protein (c-di-GMP phosphodiesterase class II)